MKLALVLLIILPAVLCAPKKRIVYGGDVLHHSVINGIQHQLYETLGADATEHACEHECLSIITAHNIYMQNACKYVCQTYNAYVLNLQERSRPNALEIIS